MNEEASIECFQRKEPPEFTKKHYFLLSISHMRSPFLRCSKVLAHVKDCLGWRSSDVSEVDEARQPQSFELRDATDYPHSPPPPPTLHHW
jgi:hypothetical protein